MTTQLYNKEKLRVSISDLEVFLDIHAEENTTEDRWNKGLSVYAYDQHQIFLIKKERVFKLFCFRKNDKVSRDDFGYYKDGELVFTNSKIIQ